MKKLVLVVTVLLATFITLTITQDYTAYNLGLHTGLYGNSILLVIYIGMLMRREILYDRLKTEDDKTEVYARSLEKGLAKYKQKDIDNRDTISLQVVQIDNYDSMWEQLKATINLGDTVTRVNYFKVQIVQAMKLNDTVLEYDKPLYQFVKGGKWYKRNEIKKVINIETKKIEKREV